MTRIAGWRRFAAIALAGLVIGCADPAPSLLPTTAPAAAEALPDPAAIASSITEVGLRSRLDSLAAIGTTDAGYRAVGTAGFDSAADLIASELRDAGWQVTDVPLTTPAFIDAGTARLIVDGQTFIPRDILPLTFAPGGDVSGPVVAIDWADGALGRTGKGCATGDYGDLPDGAIVVVRSGPCYRRDQIKAAQQAGAVGFVAAYPQAGRGAALRPTLIDPAGLRIPAVGASLPAAQALVDAAGASLTARLVTEASAPIVTTRSIIAELPGREPDRVVMLGAHLDSVVDGPGINDNGSGVAALLELADALRGTVPAATIRLAFWTAEELGLRGSTQYVGDLSTAELGAIEVYLNADMLASPNGIAGVYDEPHTAPGSTAVRDRLIASIERLGGTPEPMDLGGGSDHQAFTQVGVPTGGVFAGANERISTDQARRSGATAGQVADPCYHQPCDDGSDLNFALARLLAAALAEVAVELATDSAPVPG
jgi:Zn-dependent M28 family amino/carboxypeptidase